MCEITINIDKEKLHKINPIFKDTVTIRNWAQHQIDLIINEMTNLTEISPNAHTEEEQLAILKERIRRAENGEEEILTNEEVNEYINNKYGF